MFTDQHVDLHTNSHKLLTVSHALKLLVYCVRKRLHRVIWGQENRKQFVRYSNMNGISPNFGGILLSRRLTRAPARAVAKSIWRSRISVSTWKHELTLFDFHGDFVRAHLFYSKEVSYTFPKHLRSLKSVQREAGNGQHNAADSEANRALPRGFCAKRVSYLNS